MILTMPSITASGRLGPYPVVRRVDDLDRVAGTIPVAVVGHAVDPADIDNPTVTMIGALIWQLLLERRPFLAVCLGHQILGGLLGFDAALRRVPAGNATIDLFGYRRRVVFDSTLVIRSERRQVRCLSLGGMIQICRDLRTGEVHALRGPGFVSVQFHPESGELLHDLVRDLAGTPGLA